MEEEISQDYKQSMKTRKRYEVTTVDALWNAPLRTSRIYDGCWKDVPLKRAAIHRSRSNRISRKTQYLQVTSSRVNDNYKRRVDELLAKEEEEITIWRNVLLKIMGLFSPHQTQQNHVHSPRSSATPAQTDSGAYGSIPV